MSWRAGARNRLALTGDATWKLMLAILLGTGGPPVSGHLIQDSAWHQTAAPAVEDI